MHAGSRPYRDAIVAQRAFEDLVRGRAELGDVERAARDAIAAADAMGFLEIHDAVGVLDDRRIGGTGLQAAGIFAMHALIFAHQQHHGAVVALVFIELDEVPIIPSRFRHGLVGIVESGFAEGVAVPFQACYFAGLAADAGGGVHQLADLEFAVQAGAGDSAGVA